MTVETTQTKHIYNGNGATREWPVSFPYTQIADIRLAVVDAAGKPTEVASGFDVQAGAGGTTVVYPVSGAPLAAGVKLVVYRKTPTTQLVDLQNGGAFQPDVLEHDALDRTVMMVQEQQEQLDRAVKVPIGSETTPEQLLESIYAADESANNAANAATLAQGAAENAAARAKASEVLAGQAKADACVCADIAEAAKDVAIAQAKATNTLMAAEVGKINTLIADNEQGQAAAVDAARAWAETPHGVPVGVDGEGNPQYSAKHFAAEAQSISIPAGDEGQPGVLRLGTKEDHKDGAAGVAAQCSEVLRMVKEVLPPHTPEDKGKTLGLGEIGPEWVAVKNPAMWRPGQKVELPGIKLYPNCVWPDRSLVLFADWPELHAEYIAGFIGIGAADDAASYPGLFVRNNAGTGLYLPDIGGLFPRAWRPGEMQWDKGRLAGSYQEDAMQNITGTFSFVDGNGHRIQSSGTGPFAPLSLYGTILATSPGGARTSNSSMTFDASRVVRTADNTHPQSFAQPIAIYLGRHATEV